MIAANIWHWWIGVLLTLVAVAAVFGLVFGYLKKVTALQYPPKRNRED